MSNLKKNSLCIDRSNRTFMELKFMSNNNISTFDNSSNRTFMELK